MFTKSWNLIMSFKLLTFIFAFLVHAVLAKKSNSRPHIVFILADDLGWNDVSFHGSYEIITPNIDALAASGIALQNYYTSPLGSPSRASLLTGKYPIHLGLQHFITTAGDPFGLPLSEKLLPEFLKELSYKTHGIGKWHLGFHKKEYLPTNRGFDSFFGHWSGVIDYYDHTSYNILRNASGLDSIFGLDLHDGEEIAQGYQGQYATDLFTDKALNIIKTHNSEEPLFLYVSHLAPHIGNPYQPLQVPLDYSAKFHYIKNMKRRMYAGMVAKLDESIGKIFKSLHEADMLDNTIFVFSSDNGAAVNGYFFGEGSNWPLRGAKKTLFEGGVRIPGIIWSPLLKLTEHRIYNQMMHISDWLPTLYSAAGGNAKDLGTVDGINIWESLLFNRPSSRSEILLNIDPVNGESAMIENNFKIILGIPSYGQNAWYGPTGYLDLKVASIDEWIWTNEGKMVKSILEEKQMWFMKVPDSWRNNFLTNCDNQYVCTLNATNEPQLFDILEDPCECNNLAEVYPEGLARLLKKLEMYSETAIKPLNKPTDPHSDPRCHNFSFVPWLDEEHKSDCPYIS